MQVALCNYSPLGEDIMFSSLISGYVSFSCLFWRVECNWWTKRNDYFWKHIDLYVLVLYIPDLEGNWNQEKLGLLLKYAKTPTKGALMYVVGSVSLAFVRFPMNESSTSGPPITAPTRMLGSGLGDAKISHPFKHPNAFLWTLIDGIDAPRWWICRGYWSPYPTMYDNFAGLSPKM